LFRILTSKSVRRVVLLCSIVSMWGAEALYSVQAASEDGTRVSLGTVSGPPKGQVMVPLYLTPDPAGIKVGSISAAIGFKGKVVSFVRAEKGFLLDGVNAGFEVELRKDDKDPDKSILQLEVATEGVERKALREGLILSLIFRIEADAPESTKVALTFEELSAGNLDSPAGAIEPLSGKEGSIEVISPEQVPYVACFFFTH